MLSTMRSASAATAAALGPNAATVSVVPGSGSRSRNPLTRPPSIRVRTSRVLCSSIAAAPARPRPCHLATTSLDVPSATCVGRPAAATVDAANAICTGDLTVTASGPSTGSICVVRATIVDAIAGASSLAASPIQTCS